MSPISSLFSKSNDLRYSLASDDDETSGSESHSFLPEKAHIHPRSSSTWYLVIPWIVLTVAFACLSLYLYVTTRPSYLGKFETGWKTDFGPARQHISTEQVVFTGSPAFDLDLNYYVPHPDPIKYVGDPSPDIDNAWEELTWGRYILITEEEARSSLADQFGDIQQFWSPKRGGYIGGLDMFHTLHCLNRLRKELNPEYYPMTPHPNHKIHQSHCIEQIRQYIMCAGDMSLTPTRYNPSLGRSYIESDVKHTCRNFGALRQFLSDRFNGSKAVPPICPEDKTFPEEGSRSCVITD
ncbi:hypothetical protein F5884DRAFT_880154 [Xylogone sp. PMI_703]|nr:hypothetical protein F5884DRAFT_880154 [Xylogone sp. PMI_703]